MQTDYSMAHKIKRIQYPWKQGFTPVLHQERLHAEKPVLSLRQAGEQLNCCFCRVLSLLLIAIYVIITLIHLFVD